MSYPYRDPDASIRFRVDEQQREIKRLEAELAEAREHQHYLTVYAAALVPRRAGGLAPVLVQRERRRRFLRKVAIIGMATGGAMFCLAASCPVAALVVAFFAGRMVEQ